MAYKFTLLFTLFLSFVDLSAQLSFINTDYSVHFIDKQTSKPILSIPLHSHDFFEFGQQDFTIDEKLGSYQLNSSIMLKVKNMH